MNPANQRRWKSEVLDQTLLAFAADSNLRDKLIFKGARILNLRLGEECRQSLDIDTNLDFAFQHSHPDQQDRKAILESTIRAALSRHFNRQEPVRFAVEKVEATPKPAGRHPFGWDGFLVKAQIRDGANAGVKGLPAIEIDVAAFETLGPNAISKLEIQQGLWVRAYTLERIAGEKLRAFLSSLPAYLEKVGRRTDTARVKDLYDIVRIWMVKPITDTAFWCEAASEFKLACESRFIDCTGIETFMENERMTAELFQNDPTLPKDISFDMVREVLTEILDLFKEQGWVPIAYPVMHISII
jgi:hypothetical protein